LFKSKHIKLTIVSAYGLYILLRVFNEIFLYSFMLSLLLLQRMLFLILLNIALATLE